MAGENNVPTDEQKDESTGVANGIEQPETSDEQQWVEESSAKATMPTNMSEQWKQNAQAAMQQTKESRTKMERVKDIFRGYWARKKWTLPITVLALIVIVLAIPASRWAVLGLFIKEDVSVAVYDSQTAKPVSGATLTVNGKTTTTDATGKASLSVKVGPAKLTVSKRYYKPYSLSTTIGFSAANNSRNVKLDATGRQVPIAVVNSITGRGLANVEVSVLGTSTKTDKDGKANIVLPTTSDTQRATLSFPGYNSVTDDIQVVDHFITMNKFKLTPAGKLYYLSNQSGTIDVVKANLDGTQRQTILQGTGKEDQNNTALLVSRDWKYLALLSKRSGSEALYLINTATDAATQIDSGGGDGHFTLIGWSDDTFVYEVVHNNLQLWQTGQEVIKSYDATTGKLYSIDESQGQGDQSAYTGSSFTSAYLMGKQLVYVKNWSSNDGSGAQLKGKSSSLISVKPDGTAKTDIKDFSVPDNTAYSYYVNIALFEPYGAYLQVPGSNGGTNTYYKYEGGSVTATSDVNDGNFGQNIPTYLLSPSGNQTIWADQRDGKNALFVGSNNGKSAKQIATLSEYKPYGWYTENYILLSKNGSELYIMPADASNDPVKVTDYYKPPLNFNGYGGGYGGF